GCLYLTEYSLGTSGGGYYFFCSVGQTACSDDVQSAVPQHLAAQFGVVAFQAHDDGNGNPDFFNGANDAFGNHVATHDATEDVDQNCFHIVVGQDDLEGFGHSFLGGTTAHVQEVGRCSAVQLHDVHGAHRQTC